MPNVTTDRPGDRGSASRTPPWAWVMGIVVGIVILLIVVFMLLPGGGHRPGRHGASGDGHPSIGAVREIDGLRGASGATDARAGRAMHHVTREDTAVERHNAGPAWVIKGSTHGMPTGVSLQGGWVTVV